MNDPWYYWRQTRAGVDLSIHEGDPQPGFYRWPQKPEYGARKVFTPVAYWPATEKNEETGVIYEWIACRIGDDDVAPTRGAEIWHYVAKNAVSEEAYRGVAERGELWPDEPASVPMQQHPMMGHNLPPDDLSFDYLKDEIDRA